jgi:anti-anti-sigma factor
VDAEPTELPPAAPGLKTDTLRVGDALVCILAGDLHTGTREIGGAALLEALDSGPRLLAVELNAVELFTADGLNLLLALRGQARGRGVELVLVAPSAAVRRVLDATGAGGSFTVLPTVAEAVGPPPVLNPRPAAGVARWRAGRRQDHASGAQV